MTRHIAQKKAAKAARRKKLLEPAAEYAAAKQLFGDVSAESCDADFVFGQDGKPLYIPGPNDTPAKIRRRLEHLNRRLGPDGFNLVLPTADEDFDELEGVGEYDPDRAPDPADWLALDEQARIVRVEDYHRRAGIDVPNEALHASFHAVVENQIAADDPPAVRRTVARLEAEGLDRHDAVHAVGSVLVGHLRVALQDGNPAGFSNDAYAAAVDALTAEGWRREVEDDAEEG